MISKNTSNMTACIICGNLTQEALFIKDRVDYYRCKSCNFISSTPTLNPNFKLEFSEYEPSYRSYLSSQPSDRANFTSLLNWIESFVSLNNDNVAHLDIGTGSGKFIQLIRSRRPCYSNGIEPSKAIYEAFSLHKIGIECKELAEFSTISNKKFDVITAFDVLEHLPAPRDFFDSARKLLNTNGYIFISTPNVQALLPKILKRRWHHFNPYHLSYLSPSIVNILAKIYRLEVVEISHKAKKVSLVYLFGYVKEFLFQIKSNSSEHHNKNDITIPLNLHDIMYIVLRKKL